MSTTLMSTILVVEDTLSELELMSHYLREGGYTVINAIGSKEALNKISDQKPDVIIT
ncbi:MAG: two-component system response regulator, partial [Nostoc sp. C3-bin3]|nr:two-component system response regulator [Nostoc sp. C3-bin3]